jgi:hypothetical protein
MNLLVFPKGEFRINDRTVDFEAKFEEIVDNFENGLIPNPRLKMNGGDYGEVVNYSLMEDGLYFEIETEDAKGLDLSTKYPFGKLIDFADTKGNYYHNVLSDIILFDQPQYIGNQQKQLDAMSDCVSEMVSHGKTQEQAVAICINKLGGEKLDYIQPKLQDEVGIGQPVGQPKPTKSKLELLADFKKQLEKNGFVISDQKLEELLQVIEITGVMPQLRKLNQTIKLNIGNPIQVIKIFPRKKCYFEKYEETIDFDEKFFDEVMSNFDNPKLFKPYMDEDHNLEEKYADILKLEKRDDGLYAQIELNSIGLDAIKNNKYSYISPEWGDRVDTEKKLHKNVLWAVTLTNIPAFEGELDRLQDQMRLKKNKINKGDKQMSKKLISVAADLKKLDLTHELQDEGNLDVIAEIGAMLQEALAKIAEITQAKEQGDEQIQEQAQQIASMTKATEEKEMNDFFESAVKTGKIPAGEVETLKELYSLDKVKVKTLIDGRKETDNKPKALSIKGKIDKLTQQDYDIMDEQGYKNADGTYQVEKYKKAIGGSL